MIAEGLALIDKAMRHRRPGPYQVQAAIAALHARAARAGGHRLGGDRPALRRARALQPSPVVTLNRAVAVAKVRGPEAALAMIEPLAPAAFRLFPLLRRQGRAAACSSAAREEARVAFDRAIALANTAGGGRPYPHASRPADEGQRAQRKRFQTRESEDMTDQVQGVIPHLVVRDAAAALEFYKNGLGARRRCGCRLKYGKRIMHSEIQLNGARVFVRDHFPEHCTAQGGHRQAPPEELGGTPVTLHLEVPNCDDAVSRAVEAGAEVIMPPMDAFWGACYAQIVDPFGYSWSFAHPLQGGQE